MADSIATLQAALDNINAQIETVTASPKPNYTINGQSVQWGDFLKQLLDAQQNLNERLLIASGPAEYVVEGVT